MKIKYEIKAHGVKFLLSSHKSVRKLKREFTPSNHGYKVWPSTWLLIDYLARANLTNGQRILDIGCGWGLAGIFCAKKLNAIVTCVDSDEDVYPFLKMMAEINHVRINFLGMEIDNLNRSVLKDTDIMIGSDICFCDSLIGPIKRLIKRAKKASVKQILISDPGRWPFDDLWESYKKRSGTELIEREINSPVNATGRILRLDLETEGYNDIKKIQTNGF